MGAEMIATIVGVLVGFVLAVGWEEYRDWKSRTELRERFARVVLAELVDDRRIIAEIDIPLLDADSAAASEAKSVTRPLVELNVSIGQAAVLQGAFGARDNLDLDVGVTFSRLKQVNVMIQNRELYRATNGAMSNYDSRRAMMNKDLRAELTGSLSLIDSLVKQLQSGGRSTMPPVAKMP